jgi:hypothetical protein
MTTLTITSADVGTTIAQNGVMSRIVFVTSSREVFSNFTLVDDAPPYDIVPRQLFNSDLLCALTNSNGVLQFPAGVQLEGSVTFGNLTVAACPKNAVFEIDCTGAVAAAEIEQQRQARQRKSDAEIIMAERIRAGIGARPPTSIELMRAAGIAVEEPPPAPPDPDLVAAAQKIP